MAEEIEEIKKPSNVEKSLISNDVLSEFSVEEENLQGQEDDFLNMALEINTELTAIELIVRIQEIEHKMGRIREFRNGPRIIDIDILLYNDEVISHPNLKVPHPEMHKRNFVLKPLNEISPQTIHPVLKENIEKLKNKLINPDKVELWTN